MYSRLPDKRRRDNELASGPPSIFTGPQEYDESIISPTRRRPLDRSRPVRANDSAAHREMAEPIAGRLKARLP
jgi:hypothetical protein